MNWYKVYKRRKEGEEMISKALLKYEIREVLDTINSEIDTLLNLGLTETNTINVFESKTRRRVYFYYFNSKPANWSECEIEWSDWSYWTIVKFNYKALKAGIKKENRIGMKYLIQNH